mgnify:CR=1 FL=1
MAATTITGQQILMKIADDTLMYQSAFVREVTSQTVLVLGGVSIGDRETFKYALATVNGGGIRKITAYDESTETITLEGGFGVTVAAGDVIKIAWWDAKKRDAAMNAIRETIRQTWGVFGREVLGATSISLVSSTAEYNLPTDVGELWRVGILLSNGKYDLKPEDDIWRMGGEYGAFVIRFLDNTRFYAPRDWAGETLYAWYMTKEPEIALETDSTRLPLDAFTRASYLFLNNIGAPKPKADEDANALLMEHQSRLVQLKTDGDLAFSRLRVGRPKRPLRRRYER